MRGARPAARRRRGLRRVREPRRRQVTGRCSARSTASRGATPGTSRPTSRPDTSACRDCSPHPDEPSRFWAIVQGFGIFETTDDGAIVDAAQPRAARRLAAREPRGRLLRPQARDVARRQRPPLPAEPRRHAPQRRRRAVLDGDHRRPADRVRLRRRRAPARPRHLLRHPARPGPRPLHAGRAGGRLAHAGRRLELAPARRGLPQQDAHLGVLREGMAIDSLRRARPLLRHEHRARCSRAPTRARAGTRSRATCRRSRRSRWRCSRSRWPTCTSRATLPPLFRDLPRQRRGRGRDRRRGDRRARRALARPARPAVRARARRCARTSTSTSTASAPGSTRALGARSRVDVIAAISGG